MSRFTYNRIKILLAEANKSNIDLADFMKVKEQTVSSWCTNTNQPEVETIYKISTFFGIDAREILTPNSELKEVKKKMRKAFKSTEINKAKKKRK